MQVKKEYIGFSLIVLLLFLGIVSFMIVGPLPQDTRYHSFADSQTIFGIPNFFNVISGVLFFYVGLAGLYKLYISQTLNIIEEMKIVYGFYFLAIVVMTVGTSYYHLWPDNGTLFWDRLSMSFVFMLLLTIIISEFSSKEYGKKLLLPLILIGLFSVMYWDYSESIGQGDLRFYGLMQYLSLLILPILLIFFRSHFTRIDGYWGFLLAYLVAKIFEILDKQIFATLGFISGHSLKHLIAAVGLYLILRSFEQRKEVLI